MPIISGSTVIRGSKGNPVSQDENDALECVMKGNYEGALKTWKVDSDGRGEMFLNDLTDEWGNTNIIGLGETAARLGAVSRYDKRGEVIAYDDFEADKLSWVASGAATNAIVIPSIDSVSMGSQSVKLTTNSAVGATARITRFFPFSQLSNFGVEFSFTKDDNQEYTRILLELLDGTWQITSEISIDVANSRLQCYDGAWQTFASGITLSDTSHLFYTLKLVVDLVNRKYIRCLFLGQEYDLSAYSCDIVGVGGVAPVLYARLTNKSNNVAGSTIYADRFVLTQREPDNA